AQMAYLSRNGDVPLERSERFMGIELDSTGRDKLVAAWGFGERSGGADKTSHFVVSFPIGTPHGAASAAGRAWAEEMFEIGRFGDSWDYYTAFHTDKAHPHVHVVVNRRGLDNGDWLKVSKRSEITYDTLREVQVEVSTRYGIHLDASPRYARGVTRPGLPDGGYRRQARGEPYRRPVSDAFQTVTAAAAILTHVRQYAANARVIGQDNPGFAGALEMARSELIAGHALDEAAPSRIYSPKEVSAMSNQLDAKRREVIDNFKEIHRQIGEFPHGADRVAFARAAAAMKRDFAAFLPDADHLREYQAPPTERYTGIEPPDTQRAGEIKAMADDRVRQIAVAAGLDGQAMVARHQGGGVPPALAEQWAREEASELGTVPPYRDQAADADRDAAISAQLDALHGRIGDVYRQAAIELDKQAQREAELRDAGRNRRVDRARIALLVRATLSAEQQQALETGDAVSAFAEITEDAAAARRLGDSYLAEAQRDAPAEDQARLQAARQRIAEEAANEATRGRGKDRDDGYSL
ncbi:MAG: relaxase/mobilization nuclease domain-containing protein, partial [Caldilineaceae bacterium]|nr:relaxase/mobilization nuclease domain-containing protein [Caldilineaceae bacterium]